MISCTFCTRVKRWSGADLSELVANVCRARLEASLDGSGLKEPASDNELVMRSIKMVGKNWKPKNHVKCVCM